MLRTLLALPRDLSSASRVSIQSTAHLITGSYSSIPDHLQRNKISRFRVPILGTVHLLSILPKDSRADRS